MITGCNDRNKRSVITVRKSQSKYLHYKNHKIYYEVRGDSKKTLVFIHGWTSSIQSWKYQLDSFNNYKLIAVDLPGNGLSSKNEEVDYTMELFADSINALLSIFILF